MLVLIKEIFNNATEITYSSNKKDILPPTVQITHV